MLGYELQRNRLTAGTVVPAPNCGSSHDAQHPAGPVSTFTAWRPHFPTWRHASTNLVPAARSRFRFLSAPRAGLVRHSLLPKQQQVCGTWSSDQVSVPSLGARHRTSLSLRTNAGRDSATSSSTHWPPAPALSLCTRIDRLSISTEIKSSTGESHQAIHALTNSPPHALSHPPSSSALASSSAGPLAPAGPTDSDQRTLPSLPTRTVARSVMPA